MSWDSDTDHRADGKKIYKKNKYGNKKPKREKKKKHIKDEK